jgi:hypothetical protein
MMVMTVNIGVSTHPRAMAAWGVVGVVANVKEAKEIPAVI